MAGERADELAPLRALLEQRRARELAKLRRALRSRRFAAALEAWRALATAPPSEEPRAALPIEVVAADRIRRVYRRMVQRRGPDRRREPGRGPPRAAQARQGAALPARAVRLAVPDRRGQAARRALKDLQDVLGRFQDRSVQTEMLRESRRAGHAQRRAPRRAGGRAGHRRPRGRRATDPPGLRQAVRGLRLERAAQLVRGTFGEGPLKVLATYSIKGGVGKTSAAVNLAALAAAGGSPDADLGPRSAGRRLVPVPGQAQGQGRREAGPRTARSAERRSRAPTSRASTCCPPTSPTDTWTSRSTRPEAATGVARVLAHSQSTTTSPSSTARLDLARLRERVHGRRPAARAPRSLDLSVRTFEQLQTFLARTAAGARRRWRSCRWSIAGGGCTASWRRPPGALPASPGPRSPWRAPSSSWACAGAAGHQPPPQPGRPGLRRAVGRDRRRPLDDELPAEHRRRRRSSHCSRNTSACSGSRIFISDLAQ